MYAGGTHSKTGELLCRQINDGLDPGPPSIEPLDDWYDGIYGNSQGVSALNPYDLRDIYYKGINICDILDKHPETILGTPLGGEEGILYLYDGMEINFTDHVEQLDGYDLSLFDIHGNTLDKTRAELINLFGNPVEYYEYPDYVYHASNHPHFMLYHVKIYSIDRSVYFLFENPDNPGDKAYCISFRMMGQ